jgi:hypothetical protein
MLAPWVVQEMKTASLKDKRLNKRLDMILDQLARRPMASIPAACGGYAETKATYRFFDNDKVSFEEVLEPHVQATRHRVSEQPTVVVAQDTSEMDLTRPEQQIKGAGPLDGSSRRGVLLHLLHAFTPDGTALGTLQAVAWARDEETPSCSKLSSAQRVATPIEEKESYRWIVTLQNVQRTAEEFPETRFVCVADSEADIYELLVEATKEPQTADWVVRACHDRTLVPDLQNERSQEATTWEEGAATRHLREQVVAAPVLFTQTINIRGRKKRYSCDRRTRRQPRKSRTADVEVRAARVTLAAPWRPGTKLPDIAVNVVLVREVDPPAGDVAVEWILLTSLPIESPEYVRQVIQYYCVRWLIEVFFRTLKSGCRVEGRRFEELDRWQNCLAVYLIVTWRTLFVCRLGREFPEISCEAVFEPAEWQSVYQVIHRKPPPRTPPKLAEMVRLVAQLGGYVNRKRDDPPGPQTVWLGLQRLHDMALCWQIFGPGAKQAT